MSSLDDDTLTLTQAYRNTTGEEERERNKGSLHHYHITSHPDHPEKASVTGRGAGQPTARLWRQRRCGRPSRVGFVSVNLSEPSEGMLHLEQLSAAALLAHPRLEHAHQLQRLLPLASLLGAARQH